MESLEKKLGYRFRDRALLGEALNHSSYANEHRGGLGSNERQIGRASCRERV